MTVTISPGSSRSCVLLAGLLLVACSDGPDRLDPVALTEPVQRAAPALPGIDGTTTAGGAGGFALQPGINASLAMATVAYDALVTPDSSRVRITFEGPGTRSPVDPTAGVSFPGWETSVDGDLGDPDLCSVNTNPCGNFANEPSPSTALFFIDPTPPVLPSF